MFRRILNMLSQKLRIPFCQTLVCKILVCQILGWQILAHAEKAPLNAVENLTYANALYYFYLNSPLDSLTQIEILRTEPSRVNTSPTDTQNDTLNDKKHNQLFAQAILLETAMKLDYGMELSAKTTLTKNNLIQESFKNTDQLWFYLSQIFYDRQLFDFTRETIANVKEPDNLINYDKWQYLTAQLLLKNNDVKSAQKIISQIHQNSIYRIYAQFNLAIYFYQDKQTPIAMQMMDALLVDLQKTSTQEQAQLKDRILISAAYMNFYANDYDRALSYFQNIQTQSLFLDEALLGLGKAAIAKKQYSLAIQLWKKFEQHPLLTHRKIEATVALAKLYEQENKNDIALTTYEQADTLCDERQGALKKLLDESTVESLWKPFSQFSHARSNTNDTSEKIPEIFTQNPFLIDLLYSENFSSQLDNLRDIEKMQNTLATWNKKVPLYQEILDTKTDSYKHKSLLIADKKSSFAIDDIQQQYGEMKQWLDQVQINKDVTALNNTKEQRLQDKITASEVTANELKDDPFSEEYSESLRRVKGVMLWNAYSHYHARLWYSRKQLNALDNKITEYNQLSSSLNSVIEKNSRFPDYQQKISSNIVELTNTLTELEEISVKAKNRLKHSFDQAVNNEINQTLDLQRKSRIAIARVSESFLIETNQ